MGNATHAGRLIIWHVSDNRRGHDNQCLGLAQSLKKLRTCEYFKIGTCSLPALTLALLRRHFPPGAELPGPDLIIGAGHQTHATMLCAKRIRGGRTVVLMRPSLPVAWFDLCLCPAHDNPPASAGIIITEGALTRITPSDSHDPGLGLILIGGPSRHYHWDTDSLLQQIRHITAGTPEVRWQITDSPRTPASTTLALEQLRAPNIDYVSPPEQAADWMAAQLAGAGRVWITMDSVSMIYEALTAGAAVGLLTVPSRHHHRIIGIPEKLQARRMITLYQDWAAGAAMVKPPLQLNESARCADLLLKNLAL